MFTNYGFQFSATQEVSRNRENKLLLPKIYTEVLIVRLFIGSLILILSLIVLSNFPKFEDMSNLVLLGSGVIFGTVLQPNYLFQGKEKMNKKTQIIPIG